MMMKNRDFRRVHVSITLEGLVFFVILGFVAVCSILRNVNLLVVVSGMMFGPLLLSWRLSRQTVRNLIVERKQPQRIHVGQAASIQWEATNLAKNAAMQIKVTDTISQVSNRRASNYNELKHRRQQGQVIWHEIKASQSEFSSYQVLFNERGIYALGPAVVSCQFPLGLIRSWFRTPSTIQIYAAPRSGVLLEHWRENLGVHSAGMSAQTQIRGLQDDKFFALRKWRSGDSLRQIHWRSTAKYRHPMAKQFERTTDQDVVIVVDLFAPESEQSLTAEHLAIHPKSNIETILSFVTTILLQWSDAPTGDIVIAIAGQDLEVVSSAQHASFLSEAMQHLAVAQANSETRIVEAISTALDCTGGPADCLVVSPRSAPTLDGLEVSRQDRTQWFCCHEESLEGVFSLPTHGPSAKDLFPVEPR